MKKPQVKPQLILDFHHFYDEEIPLNRLEILNGVNKLDVLIELAGINYKLKPTKSIVNDSSLKKQIEILEYFCINNNKLFLKISKIANNYTENQHNFPLIFTRQSCLFALEEIVQCDLKVIPDYVMSDPNNNAWEKILKYILAVNFEITKIEKSEENEAISFENLNPKLMVLNEFGLNSDPFNLPFRGIKLLNYLNNHQELSIHIKDYFSSTYSMEYDEFLFEIISMYFSNKQEDDSFNFFYVVPKEFTFLFEKLSLIHKSNELSRLLSIRKYPFIRIDDTTFILTDNILLLEKIYNQFVNDFWFDYLKDKTDEKGKNLFSIKSYRAIIGYFFENYIEDIINFSYSKAKHDTVLMFDNLKTYLKNNLIEIADLYIRHNSKIILAQAKSSSIYDNEKYSGNINGLYKNNRAEFYKVFGVNQIVNSIKILNETMPNLDTKFPTNKSLNIYPTIIINEKALQTPLMAVNFQKRFEELLQDFNSTKITIKPLAIIHVSDLENIQECINENPKKIWDLLDHHSKNKDFMIPFFHTININLIRPNYKKVIPEFEKLIMKFNPDM